MPTPLEESGATVQLEIRSAEDAALRVDMGVNEGVNADEHLQTSYPPGAERRQLPPSQWQA